VHAQESELHAKSVVVVIVMAMVMVWVMVWVMETVALEVEPHFEVLAKSASYWPPLLARC
jgi:hypothetical protein